MALAQEKPHVRENAVARSAQAQLYAIIVLLAREKEGAGTGSNPLDRARPISKRHIVTDARGVLLTIVLTGAHVHDSTVFEDLIDSIAPVKGKRDRLRRRPEELHIDKGYDYPRCRRFPRFLDSAAFGRG
jgi:hypothetical protein